MRVGELRNRLSKFDSNLEVLCYTEDEALLGEGGSAFLDIEAVDKAVGERIRNSDGVPRVRFEKTDHSETLVILEVSSDF